MPRQARLNLPGLFYHVMVRGIERRPIFRIDSDRWDFLRRLGEGLVQSGCRCFAWALMTNHLHLLILSGARGLVSLMHPLLTGYAVTFNLKYNRVGHLFQNRYKSLICEEDPYFLELVRYIALQPVRAGLIETPEQLAAYRWTSHRAMMGYGSVPWLEVDDVLRRFGSSRSEARKRYLQFLRDGWNQGRRRDLEGSARMLRPSGTFQKTDSRILGDGNFVEQVLRQAEEQQERRETLSPKWSLDTLGQAVSDFHGISTIALRSGDRRAAVAHARAVFIYAARDWLGITGATMERWLKLRSGSISKAYARGKHLAADGKLLKLLKGRKGSNVP